MGEILRLYWSKVWVFLRPFVKMFLSKAGSALAAAALEAVKAVATTYAAADGDAKRKAAFEIIEDKLKRQGVEIGVEVTSSMINGAIEVAVARLKAEG